MDLTGPMTLADLLALLGDEHQYSEQIQQLNDLHQRAVDDIQKVTMATDLAAELAKAQADRAQAELELQQSRKDATAMADDAAKVRREADVYAGQIRDRLAVQQSDADKQL